MGAQNDGSTFTSGDAIDAGAGADTLDVRVTSLADGATTTTADVTGLESIEVRNVDDSDDTYTYNAASTTGLTSVGVKNGDADSETAFIGLASVVETNIEGSVDELTVTHDADLLDGSSDTVTVNATDAVVGTFLDINAGDDAIEELEIKSGGDASDLRNIDVGTALETLVLSGSGDLQVDDAGGGTDSFDDVTEVDASDLAGDLDIDMGGNDEDLTFTGGSGNDRIVIASGELTTDDTIDGDAGDADRVAIASADIGAVADSVSNVEELEFTDNAATPDLSTDIGGITTFVYSGGGSLTPTNSTNDVNHVVVADADDIDPGQAEAGLNNVLNVELRDADMGTSLGDGNDNTINLTSSVNENGDDPDDGFNSVASLDVNAGGTVNVTGSADLIAELGNAAVVDAADFTGALTVIGAASSDEITLGAGDDRILYNAAAQSTISGNADTINDFDEAGDDGLFFNAETTTAAGGPLGSPTGSLFSAAITGSSLQLITGSTSSTASLQTVANVSGANNLTIDNAVAVSGLFGSFASTTAFTEALTGITTGISNSSTYIAFALNTAGTKLFVASASEGGDGDSDIDAATVIMEINVENVAASDLFIF